MQTFILDFDLYNSASMLDTLRLSKQLTEGYQIDNILTNNKSGAWSNHPIVLLHKQNISFFHFYLHTIAIECAKRNINHKFIPKYENYALLATIPHWLTTDFVYRHRQALLFKTALKLAVYEYCYYSNNTHLVPSNANFGIYGIELREYLVDNINKYHIFIGDLNKQHPLNSNIFTGHKRVTKKMIDSATYVYGTYQHYWPTLDHKIDYLWS